MIPSHRPDERPPLPFEVPDSIIRWLEWSYREEIPNMPSDGDAAPIERLALMVARMHGRRDIITALKTLQKQIESQKK